MTLEDYQAMISQVATSMSQPDSDFVHMPENDLHPDPVVLRDKIKSLNYRVQDLELRVFNLERRGNDN